MNNTALGAENKKEQTINFISEAHEKFYYEKLKEVRYQDVYHKALCYCLGIRDDNVAGMRQFYMAYKDREDEIIQSGIGQFEQAFGIVQSGIGQLETAYKKIPFKLSWTHYQILMRIEDKDERDFYEKEAMDFCVCHTSFINSFTSSMSS